MKTQRVAWRRLSCIAQFCQQMKWAEESSLLSCSCSAEQPLPRNRLSCASGAVTGLYVDFTDHGDKAHTLYCVSPPSFLFLFSCNLSSTVFWSHLSDLTTPILPYLLIVYPHIFNWSAHPNLFWLMCACSCCVPSSSQWQTNSKTTTIAFYLFSTYSLHFILFGSELLFSPDLIPNSSELFLRCTELLSTTLNNLILTAVPWT